DRRGQPDESTPHSLAEREAELQLGGRLMDLVNDERVVTENVAVLEPSPSNTGGHDDHVPCRRLGGRLALAVHDADSQRGLKDLFGDGTNRQGFSGACSGNDTKCSPTAGELAHLPTVLSLEERFDVQAERDFDRFARSARWGDNDYAPGRRLR